MVMGLDFSEVYCCGVHQSDFCGTTLNLFPRASIAFSDVFFEMLRPCEKNKSDTSLFNNSLFIGFVTMLSVWGRNHSTETAGMALR